MGYRGNGGQKVGDSDGVKMERKTRFELATPSLARRCSTTEPLPPGLYPIILAELPEHMHVKSLVIQGNRVLIKTALPVPVIPANAGIQRVSAFADIAATRWDRLRLSQE